MSRPSYSNQESISLLRRRLQKHQKAFQEAFATELEEFVNDQKVLESILITFRVTRETLHTVPIESLLEEIEFLCDPLTLTLQSKANFTQRKQDKSETLEDYVKALRKLGETCEFDNAESRIKEQFLIGILRKRERKEAVVISERSRTPEEIIEHIKEPRPIPVPRPSSSRLLPAASNSLQRSVSLEIERTAPGRSILREQKSFSDQHALPHEGNGDCSYKGSESESESEPEGPAPKESTFEEQESAADRHTLADGLCGDTKAVNLSIQKRDMELGIEGKLNSCYLDASLMSLFMFDSSFEKCFDELPSEIAKDDRDASNRILDVVTKLKKEKKVNLQSFLMSRCRVALSKIDGDFLARQMDPEVVMEILFEKVVHAMPFYCVADGDGGYVFQLMMTESKADACHPDIQSLLDHTFQFQDIQLDDVPTPGFILKLPVCNGDAKFNSVLPNPEIFLGKILKSKENSIMELSAIICLQKNHFTVFLREERSRYSDWIQIDSFEFGAIGIMPRFTEALDSLQNMEFRLRELEESSCCRFILQNAYMCIYLPKYQLFRRSE